MELKLGDLMGMGNTERLRLSDDGSMVKESGGRFGRWAKVQWLNIKTSFSRSARERYIQENRNVMNAFIKKIESTYGKELADIARTQLKMDIEGGRPLTGYKVKNVINRMKSESYSLFKSYVDTMKNMNLNDNPDMYLHCASNAVKLWKNTFSKYESEGLSLPWKVIINKEFLRSTFENLQLSPNQMAELSEATLNSLREAMSLLDIHHLDAAIDAEINRRIDKVTNEVRSLTSDAFDAIQRGDIKSALKKIGSMYGKMKWLHRTKNIFYPESMTALTGEKIKFSEFTRDFIEFKCRVEFDHRTTDVATYKKLHTLHGSMKPLIKMKARNFPDQARLLDFSYNALGVIIKKLVPSKPTYTGDLVPPEEFISKETNETLKKGLGIELKELTRLSNEATKLADALSSDTVNPLEVLRRAYSLGASIDTVGITPQGRYSTNHHIMVKRRLKELFSKEELGTQKLLQMQKGINAILSNRVKGGEEAEVAFKALEMLKEFIENQTGKAPDEASPLSGDMPMKHCVKRLQSELKFMKDIGVQGRRKVFTKGEVIENMNNYIIPSTGKLLTVQSHVNNVNVCKEFYGDFNRSTYVLIHSGEEKKSEIISATQFDGLGDEERDRLFKEGLMKLRDFVGGDDEYLFKVSQYINQSILNASNYAFKYPYEDSEFRVNDRGFNPVSVDPLITYRISKNEKGEIRFTVQQKQRLKGIVNIRTNAFSFSLDADNSYNILGAEILIPKEGNARVERAFYQYEVKGATIHPDSETP